MGDRLEDPILEFQLGTDVDEGALILCSVAVLGSREDGDTASVVLNLVPFHAHFVRPDNRFQAVVLTEPLGHIRAELESHSSLAGPATGLGLRIGPEHLHHQTLLAWLPLAVSVEFPDIIQSSFVVGEEAAVQHQILVTDQCSQRQSRERLGEHLEHRLVILGPALSFKPVHLIHIVRLMVTAVDEKAVRAQPLVCI